MVLTMRLRRTTCIPSRYINLCTMAAMATWAVCKSHSYQWLGCCPKFWNMVDRLLRGRGERVWGKVRFTQGYWWIWGMRGFKGNVRPKEFQWGLLNLNEAFCFSLSSAASADPSTAAFFCSEQATNVAEPFLLTFGCTFETRWVSLRF